MAEARLKGIHLLSDVDYTSDKLIGRYQEAEIFSIPFDKVNNTAIYNGNEVEIDIPFEDFNENHDVFCGIRLYVPTKNDALAEEVQENTEPNLAEIINDAIKKKSKMEENMGDLLCTLPDLPLVVPRGKYTADLYRDTSKSKGELKLHGSTFSYKINFKNIVKAFLLPQNDDVDLCNPRRT
jgi:structure-specific recognition protein 1